MTSGRSGHRDINADAAQATAKRIGDAGGSALAAEFDLADERSVRALFDTAVDRPGRADELYNVAANASADVLGRDGDLLDMDPAVWRRTLEVNLISFALTPAAVHLPLAQGGGTIVNTSSASAHVGDHQRAGYQAEQSRDQRARPPRRLPLGQAGHPVQLCVTWGVMTESAEKMALTLRQLQNVTDRRF
ncbi:SDR family oxidoreductase [Streptomyces sp. NBC_01231]|nr:SDR family oxidoreductase [Streptomyces sp. NBC_01231]